jgi:tetratricopeptide (TPR) repeat protein
MEESTQSEFLEEANSREAIAFWRSLLDSNTLDAHDRVACLVNLGNALSELAELSCDAGVAKEAVDHIVQAHEVNNPNSPDQAAILSDLSAAYLTCFELSADWDSMDQAVASIRASVAATSENSQRLCARLANLCNTLCTAFEARGDRRQIDEAVATGQRASLAPNAPADDRARALDNYAKALASRFEAFQVRDDLVEAVKAAAQAVPIAQDKSIRVVCTTNLVGHLLAIAERDGTDEQVDSAIKLGNEVYDELDGPVDRARCAHNLSYLHRLRFERVDFAGEAIPGDVQDLQRAVDLATDAINLYPGMDAQLAMYEDHLAVCLELVLQHSTVDDDKLAIAIDCAESAVSRVDAQDPRGAVYTNHLVSLLRRRLAAQDLERAASLSVEVLNSENAELLARIAAGQASGFVNYELGRQTQAFASFKHAVELLPLAAENALKRRDQQYVLSQCMGLSSMAASTALDDGRPASEALDILETGRAILTRFAISEKSVETQVSEQARCGSESSHVSATNLTKNGIDALGADFAVAFNVTMARSDALVVARNDVISVSLPKLKASDLLQHVRKLLGPQKVTEINLKTYADHNHALAETMIWLWNSAVEPVLQSQNLVDGPARPGRLPRVCWIASGAMGLMPMHAAGYHTGESTDYTMAHVVSSYAVSVRAAAWSHREANARVQSCRVSELDALAIAMAETPGKATLGVQQELSAFSQAMPKAVELSQPNAAHVLQRLATVQAVHFACHAESNPHDPSNSTILLLADDKQTIDRLTVYALAESHFPRAQLAFLSACQTVDQQNLDHIDESIHLAGAFQIAGFPQVIGSLWEAEDEYASKVAVAFYGRFAECDRSLLKGDDAVLALHDTMTGIRAEDPDLILSWAPFVIYGV